MVVNMKGKHLASLHDLTKEEIWQILKTAETLKIKQKTGEHVCILPFLSQKLLTFLLSTGCK